VAGGFEFNTVNILEVAVGERSRSVVVAYGAIFDIGRFGHELFK
jgi:hypothetical protein